jgi:uncharacterized membrane protein
LISGSTPKPPSCWAPSLGTDTLITVRSLTCARHYSACAGDTWASELGVLATHDPHLVLTGRRVPRGTNGAVSVLGCLATLFGGAAIGVAVFVAGYPMYSTAYLAKLVALGAACGAFGSLVDSLLGATLQYSGFCLTCTKVRPVCVCVYVCELARRSSTTRRSTQRAIGSRKLQARMCSPTTP